MFLVAQSECTILQYLSRQNDWYKMHTFIKEISSQSLIIPVPVIRTACVFVCSCFSHLLESFLLVPPYASFFHHYSSDATAQHPPHQLLPSEVTHESKSKLRIVHFDLLFLTLSQAHIT